jgi:hypothetical protein
LRPKPGQARACPRSKDGKEFAPGFRTFTASCQGKIYPPGQDPFAPTVPPSVEFDCSYLNGFHYQRVPLD